MPRTSTAKERLTEAALDMIWESSYGATSVDAICERANVKKGSFYYFFKSKSELAAAALDADHQKHQPELDRIFSSSVPPLERLRNYHDWCLEFFTTMLKERGVVLGCPLFTLGSEVCCSEETALRDKIQQILERKLRYYESMIRDAHAEGSIEAPNADVTARALFALIQGALTQARIQNSLDPIREAHAASLAMLGAKPRQPMTA